MKSDPFKDWQTCIKFAKLQVGEPTGDFKLLKNKKILHIAKKCYCAMGYMY